MQKVINGKRYNTETAQLMAEWDNGHPSNDFRFEAEDLYRKKTGEFFLHGQGGGLSKYSHSHGDSQGWGEQIIPLNVEQAKAWAERLDGQEYERIFDLEDEQNSVINVLIPTSLHDKLREESEKSGVSQKEIVVKALKEYLK